MYIYKCIYIYIYIYIYIHIYIYIYIYIYICRNCSFTLKKNDEAIMYASTKRTDVHNYKKCKWCNRVLKFGSGSCIMNRTTEREVQPSIKRAICEDTLM